MDSTDCAVFLLPRSCFRCHKTASFLSKVFCILPKAFCILSVSATLEVTREEREQYRRTGSFHPASSAISRPRLLTDFINFSYQRAEAEVGGRYEKPLPVRGVDALGLFWPLRGFGAGHCRRGDAAPRYDDSALLCGLPSIVPLKAELFRKNSFQNESIPPLLLIAVKKGNSRMPPAERKPSILQRGSAPRVPIPTDRKHGRVHCCSENRSLGQRSLVDNNNLSRR